jgi:non-heme chloroperoxidase
VSSKQQDRHLLRKAAIVAVGAAAVGHVVAKRSVTRWAANADPVLDELVPGPVGHAVEVTTGDGTVLQALDVPGDGPPFVLIHGVTGDRSHWAPVTKRLAARGHRVLVMEQRGHAKSTVGEAGFTVAALGDDVAAFLEALDLRNAVVAGHSMGGLAVQSFAMNHPSAVAERVAGLGLVSTLCRSPKVQPGAARLLPLVMGASTRMMGTPWRGQFALRRSIGGDLPIVTQLEQARVTYLGTPVASRVGAFLMLSDFDISAGLESIAAPAVVVCGTSDRLTPMAGNEEIAARIPDASLITVPGAGHMTPWEAADTVTDALLALVPAPATA